MKDSRKSKKQIGEESRDEQWLDHRDRSGYTHFGRRPSYRERRREQAIKDWFGTDEARGFIRDHQKPPEHISEIMGDVLSSIGMRRQALLEELMDNWTDIVGADIARKSYPCRLMQSRLDIEVDNPSWLYILRTTHAATILQRVKEHAGDTITEIRFVPAGRHHPSERRRW